MSTPDPLEKAFADLRARQRSPSQRALPPEQLDALLDAQADPAERVRVAGAVVADGRTRLQFAQMVAVDDELAALRARRRMRRLVGVPLVLAAAAALAVLAFWPPAAPPLVGRLVVAEADGPKDPNWPPFLRARRSESLRLADLAGGAEVLHWVAIDVVGGGEWRLSRPRAADVGLSELVPAASAGPLLVACSAMPPDALLAALRAFVDQPLRDAARQSGGAGVASRLRLAVDPARSPGLLMGVLELF